VHGEEFVCKAEVFEIAAICDDATVDDCAANIVVDHGTAVEFIGIGLEVRIPHVDFTVWRPNGKTRRVLDKECRTDGKT
jgi:hypothetical protein